MMKDTSRLKNSLLGGLLLLSSCLTDPEPKDPTALVVTLIALAPRGQCVMAGLNNSTASSGLLGCASLNNYQCGSTLTFMSSGQRGSLTAEITGLGNLYGSCNVAVANALTEVNALTLPGNLLLNRMGGTAGPHVISNYSAFGVASCEAMGLSTAPFIGGASRMATEAEMSFLATARGLVALKDAVGTCRSQMGLTTTENSIAQSIISNSVARFAVCDYGADDATRADCPLALQRTELQFSGITGW